MAETRYRTVAQTQAGARVREVDEGLRSYMAPEYGATCGFFPVSEETLLYLRGTGRPPELLALVEAYCRAQGLFRTKETPDPTFTETLELDLASVEPSMAGPKRPQDRVGLAHAAPGFAKVMSDEFGKADKLSQRFPVDNANFDIGHGDVVIAAITSCTNTSNPNVMVVTNLFGSLPDTERFAKFCSARGKSLIVDSAAALLGLDRAAPGLPAEAISFHHTKP